MGEQMFMMKSEVAGRQSVVSDELVQSERRRFTISELSCEFPQISRTLLYEIITVRLGYHHKFCARRVLKNLTGAHNTQRMIPFGSDFQSNSTKMVMNFSITSYK
jgi:hypothetical protein